MSVRRLGVGFFVCVVASLSLVSTCSADTIVRGNVSDIDSTGNSSSTITESYDSGLDGTSRYSVFVVQLSGSSDAVTNLSYGGATATLLTKAQSQYAQFNNYNYIFGLAEPATSTNNIEIQGSQSIAANILAATYENVDPSQPELTGAEATSTNLSSWVSSFTTSYLHDIAVIASGDNNGNLTAGDHATKLSTTRPAGAGLQVFEGGEYPHNGSNNFVLNGSNGGASDVLYALLKPTNATTTPPLASIVRGNVSDFDDTANGTSSIMETYDSGATGTSRYAVFSVQLSNTTDDVTGVTYGSASATLLSKRQSVESGSNGYNYMYGLVNPDTGSNTLQVSGSQAIAGRIVAVTYSNVSTGTPDTVGGAGVAETTDVWTKPFLAKKPGEVVVFQSSDAAGDMQGDTGVSKLSSSRASAVHQQVWETSIYESTGLHTFGLSGSNGGGIDVNYVTLYPIDTMTNLETGIQRSTVLDFTNESNTSTTVTHGYNSGGDAADKYMVVTVQISGSDDVVNGMSYNGVNGRLLYKRKSQYSQGGNYNYIFGLMSPATGTHTLAISSSAAMPGEILAATYSGVDASQPQLAGGHGTNVSASSFSAGFETRHPGEMAIVMSGDNNGNMAAGISTEKLSTTRSAGNGLQVWQGGVYSTAGGHAFHLEGSNGSASDVAYVIMTPAP